MLIIKVPVMDGIKNLWCLSLKKIEKVIDIIKAKMVNTWKILISGIIRNLTQLTKINNIETTQICRVNIVLNLLEDNKISSLCAVRIDAKGITQ